MSLIYFGLFTTQFNVKIYNTLIIEKLKGVKRTKSSAKIIYMPNKYEHMFKQLVEELNQVVFWGLFFAYQIGNGQ